MKSGEFNLLVIDDEQDIREGCMRILNKMNCRVTAVENGRKGLDEFSKSDISIVLLDLKMPGIDGIEVLQKIKEIDESVLVIIITGFATIETAIEAMKHGAYDFISKPFDPDQLRIVVGRAMGHIGLTMQAEILRLERERTLVDLGTEKSRIHAIVEGLPTGILVTNTSGSVVLMNPVFISWFQNEKDDFPLETGRNVEDYLTDENLRQFIENISKGKFSGENIPSFEITLSNETYFLAKGQEVRGKNDECLGAVVIFNDITDLKNFDQQKSEFVAKVSHELRSPLSTIHEQLALVSEELEDSIDSENMYLLKRAKEKTGGLIALIGDLLDLSRIEAGKDFNNAKEINVIEQLDNIVEFLSSRAASKEQSLSINHLSSGVQTIFADTMSFDSIFGNLITNAIKYTPKKGKISVETNVKKDNLIVTVCDNGYGMDESQVKMIFKKFYRIKNEKTRHIVGTGLGLAIVKELVEGMQGRIMVESVVDKGSKFQVILPLNKGA